MHEEKTVTISNKVLCMSDMLKELPIKENQIRYYIKDGRLKAEKIRNKFYATRKDFDDFKLALGF